MKKNLWVITAVVLVICSVLGCGYKDYKAMQEKHAATKTYREGMWRIRYNCWTDSNQGTTFCLSVNVRRDMSEKDMLDIMDYYEFTKNAKFDSNNHYIGERETDYTCYAVFYQGDTDEEIRKIKYYNGKEVEILEKDLYCFATPESCSSEDEIGEEGLHGPLP